MFYIYTLVCLQLRLHSVIDRCNQVLLSRLTLQDANLVFLGLGSFLTKQPSII